MADLESGGNGIVAGEDGMTGQQAYVGYEPPTNSETAGSRILPGELRANSDRRHG